MKSHTPINLYAPLDSTITSRYKEVQHLQVLCKTLEDYGVKYWLDWGTLLGAYREGKVIDSDCDLDICCLLDGSDRWSLDGKKYRHQMYLLNHLQKDFYIRFFVENSFISVIPRDYETFHLNHIDIGLHCEKPSFREFFLDEMEMTTLYDMKFPCPRHTEMFLEMRYGYDWKIPREFSPRSDVIPNKKTYACYTSMVGDFFHIGHQNLLKRCRKLFDKVIVGVHNDEDVQMYKLRPYTPYSQRLEQIRQCSYVNEVYENAPIITTEEILDRVGADFVVAGREESERIQKMYPVNLRRLHLIQRTPDISSSMIRKQMENK